VPLWKKERGTGRAAGGRLDELNQLQDDLKNQLAGGDMDLSGHTDGSFIHFFINEDKVARAVGANKVGTPKHLA
jgi:hypothetical protein